MPPNGGGVTDHSRILVEAMKAETLPAVVVMLVRLHDVADRYWRQIEAHADLCEDDEGE